MSGGSLAPIENSPPWIQTIPGGAGDGAGVLLTIVASKEDGAPAATSRVADIAANALFPAPSAGGEDRGEKGAPTPAGRSGNISVFMIWFSI
jgi:hypothetical protein